MGEEGPVSPFPTLTYEPRSEEEWRAGARLAAGLLLIDDARLYGLITGGPVIDRERCVAFLDRAAEHGVEPDEQATQDAAIALVHAFNGADDGGLDD